MNTNAPSIMPLLNNKHSNKKTEILGYLRLKYSKKKIKGLVEINQNIHVFYKKTM